MNIFYSILLSFSFLFGKTILYSVEFWGIHSADITTTYTDTTFDDFAAIKIHFTTNTTPLVSKLFFVENTYTTIISKENKRLFSFTKNTRQPELTNTISTYNKDSTLFYTNNDRPVDILNPNIFTLFYLLQSDNVKNILNRKIIIEREGLTYFANISSIKNNDEIIYTLDLLRDNVNDMEPVYEFTDIFTWAVFKPGAKRIITVSNDRNIIKCEFSSGIIKMKAEAVDIQ